MARLIAVPTCWKHALRANVVRETWGAKCQEHGFDLRFFIGREPGSKTLKLEDLPKETFPTGIKLDHAGFMASAEAQNAVKLQELHTLPADTVQLDVEDDYPSLPLKIQAMAAWAEGYEYMFKTDDDCYLVPELLKQLTVAPYHYVGRFRPPSGGYPAWYASGFAYWLSAPAMSALAAAKWNGDWAEDRWVGNTLAHHGIHGRTDMQNYTPAASTLRPDVVNRCNVKNCIAFAEFGDLNDFREMHRLNSMLIREPLRVELLKPVPQIAVTAAQLYRQPSDKPPAR